jgi:Luciferase-like monooxygenase
MAKVGYTLMTEQAGPKDLVRWAARAGDVGFDLLVSSDHYFPWVDEQGHAPNAWVTLGAVAQATERAELMTYVTCRPRTRFAHIGKPLRPAPITRCPSSEHDSRTPIRARLARACLIGAQLSFRLPGAGFVPPGTSPSVPGRVRSSSGSCSWRSSR